jgi:hypothetical protein
MTLILKGFESDGLIKASPFGRCGTLRFSLFHSIFLYLAWCCKPRYKELSVFARKPTPFMGGMNAERLKSLKKAQKIFEDVPMTYEA